MYGESCEKKIICNDSERLSDKSPHYIIELSIAHLVRTSHARFHGKIKAWQQIHDCVHAYLRIIMCVVSMCIFLENIPYNVRNWVLDLTALSRPTFVLTIAHSRITKVDYFALLKSRKK